jgi:hypothetical protein
MVTSENDSDEILTLDWPSITITVRDYAKKRALCPHDRRFRKKRIHFPDSKAIQIGTNICQTNTKPWNKESRISN